MKNTPQRGGVFTTGEVVTEIVAPTPDKDRRLGCPSGCAPARHEAGCPVGRDLPAGRCWACLALPVSARAAMRDCSDYCPELVGEPS